MSYRILFLSFCLAALLVVLPSCGNGHSGENYFLISTNVKVPYWQSASAGFSQAGGRLGVAYALNGPDTYDRGGKHPPFEPIIKKKPGGILFSVADPAVIKD